MHFVPAVSFCFERAVPLSVCVLDEASQNTLLYNTVWPAYHSVAHLKNKSKHVAVLQHRRPLSLILSSRRPFRWNWQKQPYWRNPARLLQVLKAFDNVRQKHLLLKLDFYGIRGETKKWIEDFFSSRIQQVVVEDEHSYAGSVSSGVHQGSVPGPSRVGLFSEDTILCSVIRPPPPPPTHTHST